MSRKSNQIVAVKKCFDAFQNSTDAQRTFREIMYLQALSGHENIVQILNVLKAENDQDIYIVTDFMESDLHAVVKAGILQDIHKQYVVYQVLRALKFMHSGDLIHRDIKPSNILLNSDCAIKLCDFGLARSVAHKAAASLSSDPVMTDYVATRWYRAPEILLGSASYTKGVDIWAVGCLLGEMIAGQPVFPGNSTLDQLERVLDITGRPSLEDILSMKSPFAKTMLDSIHQASSPTTTREKPLAEWFPKANREMIDFLSLCFRFSPANRPSAEELLKHPLMAPFHDESTEPVCCNPIEIPLDDNVKLSSNDYRTRIYDKVIRRKKEINRYTRNSTSEITSPPSQGGGTKLPTATATEIIQGHLTTTYKAEYPVAPAVHARTSMTKYRPVEKKVAAPPTANSATESFFQYLFGRS